MTGQSNRDMTWNLLNGTEIDKVQLFNSSGTNQIIHLISGFKTNNLNIEHGTIKLSNSATVTVQD